MTAARKKPDPSTLPALAFFPWLRLDRDHRIGPLHLLAFDRHCGRDGLEIDVFERLAAADLFGGPSDAEPADKPWNAVRTKARRARACREILEFLRGFRTAGDEQDAGHEDGGGG